MRRLWKTPGFLQPTPPPPFVVGAFGPKMAEVAGRVGDGINTQAWHPQLDRMLDIARAAHADAGREPEDLLTTVFAGYDARWLRADSPPYARLVDHGVHRLILLVHAPYDRAAISAAGELLRNDACDRDTQAIRRPQKRAMYMFSVQHFSCFRRVARDVHPR